MARKVFLSFLGTTNYKECNYTVNQESKISRFVQIATISIHCHNWSKDDKYIFFMTETARDKNWKKDCSNGFSLLSELEENGIVPIEIIIPQDIYNDASSFNIEKEIWKTFEIINNQLEPEDKIVFDITHSFRYMPMLAMTLLNYAKALKKINVLGIYYGAFEVLGFASQVVEKYPNVADRKAPIVDLTAFTTLQDWTTAADTFIKYGTSTALSNITAKEITPLLRGDSEKTKIARSINQFIKSLVVVTESLQTNRGQELVEGEIFKTLQTNLQAILDNNFIVPMKPILEKVSEKVSNFSAERDWKNGFRAVEWCIEHNLIQQGITMLQESIFTYYCMEFKLNYKDEKDRKLISNCFYIINHKVEDDISKWKSEAVKRKKEISNILILIQKEIASEFDSLTQSARNDINHGGFSKNESSVNLKKKLIKSFNRIKSALDL
jgi:CRISPR-associated Csx2 family protein